MDYECQDCHMIYNEEDFDDPTEYRCPHCGSDNIEKVAYQHG